MKSKLLKRVILITLVIIMVFVFVGYKFGVFNGFLLKYYSKTLPSPIEKSVLKNIQHEGENDQPNNADTKSPTNVQSIVSIVQSPKANASDIGYDEIKRLVEEAINLSGGFEDIIKDGQVVILKPNLVQMHVDSTGHPFDKEINGPTTDWRVTKAVVEVVRKYNPSGKVYIMEGSAGDGTKKTMEYLNYTHKFIPRVDKFIAIEEDTGKWQDFSSSELIKYSLPDGLLHKEYYFNKKYLECDVLISIPCLKTNSGAVVSGAIKNVSIGATPANIYGISPINPGRTKMVSHKIVDGELHKWIYDYYMCKPVNFVILDGLQGFQNGPVPIGRTNVIDDRMNMRLIMAGRDAVAVDTIEALIAGWDPQSIPYLKYLADSGMGIKDTSKIYVVGKFVDDVKKDFKIRFSKLGGVPVQDRTPPKLSLTNQEIIDGKLNLNLYISDETTKVEILVDDKLNQINYPPECKKVILNLADFSNADHEIKIYSYDRFLNHSEVTTSFTKNEKEINKNDYFNKKADLLRTGEIEKLMKLSVEDMPSPPSSYPAYYSLPKQIIRLAHTKALERFKNKDSYKASQYAEYGLNEYTKVFINKPLTEINTNDIEIRNDDKYIDMKITPNEFILILNNYAYFVALSGNDSKAEQLLKKVIELSPNRAVAYIDLGNVSWNLGKKDIAKLYYKKYLELLGKNTKNVPSTVYERLNQ